MSLSCGFKAVVFDCDGVMFDTADANREFYNRILRRFGKPPLSEEQFVIAHMYTVDDALAFLIDDEKTLASARAYRHTMDYRQFIDYMVIEPHLVDLLRRLRPRYRIAVATNRTDSIGHVLRHFGIADYFDAVFSSVDVPRPKPHPDLLLKVLGHFGVAAEEVLYVGDSAVDEKAAHAAGIPLAAYANPSLDAAYHIDSLKDLEAFLLTDD